MSVTPEELAAFADGELSGADEARVAAAVTADPALARQVEAHRALKARLAGHFAPILDQPVPDRLKKLLVGESDDDGNAQVIEFAKARDRREARSRLPGWAWAGGALAASLVAALVFTVAGPDHPNYAEPQLAGMLDSQLTSTQPASAEARILLSFRNQDGEYCRAYSADGGGGIACRDQQGWRVETRGAASGGQQNDYRMAGSEAELLAAAQDMARGPALSADEEQAASAAGWRD